MGIVFYPTYFHWFDHATHELFSSAGRSLTSLLREDGISVPIAECGARFRAPVFTDDELVVTASIAELGSRSLRVEHHIARDGEEVATGFELRVVARLGAGGRLEVVHLPEDLRELLQIPAD
jgi:acyl-CoA thioester hydrolase